MPGQVDHLGNLFGRFNCQVSAEDLVGPLARDTQLCREFPGCLEVIEGEALRDSVGHRVSKIDTQIAPVK